MFLPIGYCFSDFSEPIVQIKDGFARRVMKKARHIREDASG